LSQSSTAQDDFVAQSHEITAQLISAQSGIRAKRQNAALDAEQFKISVHFGCPPAKVGYVVF
jgi:hypothetical protein